MTTSLLQTADPSVTEKQRLIKSREVGRFAALFGVLAIVAAWIVAGLVGWKQFDEYILPLWQFPKEELWETPVAIPFYFIFKLFMLFAFSGLMAVSAGLLLSMFRQLKYGGSVLHLVDASAESHTVAGLIRTARNLSGHVFRVQLSCRHLKSYERQKDSGGTSRSIQRQLIWSDIGYMRPVANDDRSTAIPFAFTIPENAEPTKELGRGESEGIEWVLKIDTESHGLDYTAEFVVPVDCEGPRKTMDIAPFRKYAWQPRGLDAFTKTTGIEIQEHGIARVYVLPRDWWNIVLAMTWLPGIFLASVFAFYVNAWVCGTLFAAWGCFLIYRNGTEYFCRRTITMDRDQFVHGDLTIRTNDIESIKVQKSSVLAEKKISETDAPALAAFRRAIYTPSSEDHYDVAIYLRSSEEPNIAFRHVWSQAAANAVKEDMERSLGIANQVGNRSASVVLATDGEDN